MPVLLENEIPQQGSQQPWSLCADKRTIGSRTQPLTIKVSFLVSPLVSGETQTYISSEATLSGIARSCYSCALRDTAAGSSHVAEPIHNSLRA